MQTVIIASGNKGKLKEFQELMKDLPVEGFLLPRGG